MRPVLRMVENLNTNQKKGIKNNTCQKENSSNHSFITGGYSNA